VRTRYGGLPLTTAHFQNTVTPHDIAYLVKHIRSIIPTAPLLAAGFSLGSNSLVRYLAEYRNDTHLAGAMSFGNPYDLNAQLQSAAKRTPLMQRLYGIPERRAVRFLARTVHRNADLFAAAGVDVAAASASTNLFDFAERCTCKLGGFPSVRAYYEQASCLPVLDQVVTPLVCVSALDDPVCAPDTVLPQVRATAARSSSVVLVETKKGGHLAWLESIRGDTWLTRAVTDFGAALLEHARERTPLASSEPLRAAAAHVMSASRL
jgi:predicted alpha/beta-fold hydrolase